MGYIIAYDGGDPGKMYTTRRRSRLPGLTLGFFLAFLLFTKLFWPAGAAQLRQILLPGDPDVTQQAVTVLVEDLRAGEPVGAAVKAFCSEILIHAEYPD